MSYDNVRRKPPHTEPCKLPLIRLSLELPDLKKKTSDLCTTSDGFVVRGFLLVPDGIHFL